MLKTSYTKPYARKIKLMLGRLNVLIAPYVSRLAKKTLSERGNGRAQAKPGLQINKQLKKRKNNRITV